MWVEARNVQFSSTLYPAVLSHGIEWRLSAFWSRMMMMMCGLQGVAEIRLDFFSGTEGFLWCQNHRVGSSDTLGFALILLQLVYHVKCHLPAHHQKCWPGWITPGFWPFRSVSCFSHTVLNLLTQAVEYSRQKPKNFNRVSFWLSGS